MSRAKVKSVLKPPFLKRLSVIRDAIDPSVYPFNLPVVQQGRLVIAFNRPVTIIVGENGSGKSTLLEAIARQCGFGLIGGNRNQQHGSAADAPLAEALRLSWLPRMTNGFFLRAESFFDLAGRIDRMAAGDEDLLRPYGGRPLLEQSHGESFLALFVNRFGARGSYILDEPEAALSPSRQLAFLAVLKALESKGAAQFLIATHSPTLMAYPGAQVLEIRDGAVTEIDFRDADNFRLMRRILENPEKLLAFLSEPPEAESDEDGTRG